MGWFSGFFVKGKRRNSRAGAATGNRRATALARRRGGKKSSEAKELGFDLDDLSKASGVLLGKGTFGTSYLIELETGTPLVVKSLRDFDASKNEFQELVDITDQANHRSLLPFTAYHYSDDEKLLVYEYMFMGSLYDLLHVNRSPDIGPWKLETRIGIALEVARALAHLHSQVFWIGKEGLTVSHGNVRSSNILFTNSFEVQVSEFGLAHLGGSTRTQGYLAPEVPYSGIVSQKADVYSFGVVFLEFFTRKDPTESYLVDEGMDLRRWMMSAVNGEWTSEVFDVELLERENVEVLLQYLELAFIWTATDPDARPSMAQVVAQIEKLFTFSTQVHETNVGILDHSIRIQNNQDFP